MTLAQLGWDEWFENHTSKFCKSKQTIARVTAVDRGRYNIMDENGEVYASLTGKFLHSAKSPGDYPCVGDWVCVRHFKSDDPTTIHALLPRKSTLRRKSAGRRVDYQIIGANIHTAFIMVSCHFDFNIRRLERYLAIVNECGIKPIIILTKTDLIGEEDLQLFITGIREANITNEIFPISNISGSGITEIKELIQPAHTYCLIGSSGVGKTTLINLLTDDSYENLKTAEVSEKGEGRHTTVRRQLLLLEEGAMFIDTPGMREMGILSAEYGIAESFADIEELALSCHFTDCKHTSEPRCAVLQAVNEETITEGHYINYVLLKGESESNARSYIAKQRRPLSTLKPDPLQTKHKGKNA